MALPNAEAITKIMQMASSTAEGAEYFVDRYKTILGPKAPENILNQLDEWLTLVVASTAEPSSKWDGKYVEQSTFAKLQNNLSESIISKQPDLLEKDIQLDIAISENAEILRRYTANNQPLDAEQSHSMDKLLNAWLAEDNVLIQDGVLYQANDKGDIKRDSSNQLLPAEAGKIREDLLTFEAYAKSKGIHVHIEQLPYPQPAQVQNTVT